MGQMNTLISQNISIPNEMLYMIYKIKKDPGHITPFGKHFEQISISCEIIYTYVLRLMKISGSIEKFRCAFMGL